jgi:hypothetical protein
VISVGDLVFSSDPRVRVGTQTMRGDNVEIWSLKIAIVKKSDQGIYQCQVWKKMWSKIAFSLKHFCDNHFKFKSKCLNK